MHGISIQPIQYIGTGQYAEYFDTRNVDMMSLTRGRRPYMAPVLFQIYSATPARKNVNMDGFYDRWRYHSSSETVPDNRLMTRPPYPNS